MRIFPTNWRIGMRKYTVGMAVLALVGWFGSVSDSDGQGRTAKKATRTNPGHLVRGVL